ncbi:unnamed protein product, partial [Rotaria sp. Silwood1]
MSGCCSRCNEISRGQKFARLLQHLEKCSESIMYHDEISNMVQRIRQLDFVLAPLQFHPNQIFDEIKHNEDKIAKKYLEKATGDVHHLIPIETIPDGNCLYHSILLLMENPAVTTDELRVRTVIELITNETYYENMYSQFVGSVEFSIQATCKNKTFSELYEISALCNVLRCNIRSIYPKIDFREGMEIMNNIFTPAPPTIANCDITILWSHTWYETDVRAVNNNLWSPNHFVPLMSSFIYDMSDMSDHSNTSTSIVVTPKKKTFKNNTPAQIRSPEFESPSNRRFRSENNMGIVTVQLNNSDAMRESQNGMPEKRQIRLDKRKEQSRSSRANETEEQRQIRLEKQKMRDQSSLATETDEERQIRLKKL